MTGQPIAKPAYPIAWSAQPGDVACNRSGPVIPAARHSSGAGTRTGRASSSSANRRVMTAGSARVNAPSTSLVAARRYACLAHVKE